MLIGLDYECFLYDTFEECSEKLLNSTKKCQEQQVYFPVSPFWIDIESPSPEDIRAISHMFSLHPLTEEDCLLNDSGEKYEIFKKYIFFNLFYPDNIDNGLTPINIIVFQDFVITFHGNFYMKLNYRTTIEYY
jgi:Mg2+ and Co2+ transporter CorA